MKLNWFFLSVVSLMLMASSAHAGGIPLNFTDVFQCGDVITVNDCFPFYFQPVSNATQMFSPACCTNPVYSMSLESSVDFILYRLVYPYLIYSHYSAWENVSFTIDTQGPDRPGYVDLLYSSDGPVGLFGSGSGGNVAGFQWSGMVSDTVVHVPITLGETFSGQLFSMSESFPNPYNPIFPPFVYTGNSALNLIVVDPHYFSYPCPEGTCYQPSSVPFYVNNAEGPGPVPEPRGLAGSGLLLLMAGVWLRNRRRCKERGLPTRARGADGLAVCRLRRR